MTTIENSEVTHNNDRAENQGTSPEEAKRLALQEELLAIKDKNMTTEWEQYNVQGAARQEERKSTARIEITQRLQSKADIALALLKIQAGEALEQTPDGLSDYLVAHQDRALSDIMQEIKDDQATLAEEDPELENEKIKITDDKLEETRDKLIELQYAGKQGMSGKEYKAQLGIAEKEYLEAFKANLLEAIRLDPKKALDAGYLDKTIATIQLGIANPQEITEQELFGSFGNVLMDALAREEYKRTALANLLTEKHPKKLVDRLRKNKTLKGVIAVSLAATTGLATAKGHLPEGWESAGEMAETGFRYISVYLISAAGLKGMRDKAESFMSKHTAKKDIKRLSQTDEAAEAGLRTVYGNTEYKPRDRQVTGGEKQAIEKYGGIELAFERNLKEKAPRGIPYSAETAIHYANQIVLENGDQLKEILKDPAHQEEIFINLADKLLQKQIQDQKDQIKTRRWQAVVIQVSSILASVVANDVIKASDDFQSALEKSRRVAERPRLV
jgi:hypothetical protein